MSEFAATRSAYVEAGESLLAVVGSLGPGDWERDALGAWSVRDLVGHTGRAFSTLGNFFAHPGGEVLIETVGDYFKTALLLPDVHSAIAARGRESGAELGDDPHSVLRSLKEAAVGELVGAVGTEVGLSAVGPMVLSEYLRSRVAELVIHTLDLTVAIGSEPVASTDGLRVTLDVLVEGARPEQLGPLVAALAGRTRLPSGFSVL